jgi:EpsI family protein
MILVPGRSREAAVPTVPERIGAWRGEDLAMSPRTLELLGTDRAVYRLYRSGDEGEILLCVVCASGTERAIHPPEVCYRGWGFEIVDRGETKLSGALHDGGGIRARWLELVQGNERRVSVYWYQDSRGPHTGFLVRRLVGAFARLLGRSVGWSLVRMSTPLQEGETRAGALARIREFALEALPHLDPDR